MEAQSCRGSESGPVGDFIYRVVSGFEATFSQPVP